MITFLLLTTSQTDFSDAIGPGKFFIMSFDRSSNQAQKKYFIDAMDFEVARLKKQNLCDAVSACSVPSDGIVLGGSFDLVLKFYGTPSENSKARLVVQGHKDCEKPYIVRATATLHASLIRVIIPTAAYHEFWIFYTTYFKPTSRVSTI